MENNPVSGNLTRRGFVAVCAAVSVMPNGTQPGSIEQVIAEGINPEWDGTVRMLGYVRPHSIYWHGKPPVVTLDLKRPWPWER